MADQLALLPGYLTAHLQLSLAALLLGIGLSVPLGVWVTRNRALEPGVLGVASVLQTIPSLALLALMVPLLAGLGALLAGLGVELRSIGFLPAVLALTLYSVLVEIPHGILVEIVMWQIDALHALSPHGLDDPEEEGQREHRCVDDHVGNQQVNE